MPKLTIQQASEWLSIPKSTLRFWEKEFPLLISPERTRGGQRRYTVKDLIVLDTISTLKKRGLTLNQIRKHLRNSTEEQNGIDPILIDELTEKLTSVVRREISNFLLNEGQLFDGGADSSKKRT